MRKVVVFLAILAGVPLAAPAADARPVVVPGVQLVQYHGYAGYGGGHYGEWRRHEAWARWHRHGEWRHRHAIHRR